MLGRTVFFRVELALAEPVAHDGRADYPLFNRLLRIFLSHCRQPVQEAESLFKP